MNLQEIKAAVDAGKRVQWASPAYEVIKDRLGRYLIRCAENDHCIGLTHNDGVTLNGKPEEFTITE